MSRLDRVSENIPRVIEVDEFLQALHIAIMKERLLEFGQLGGVIATLRADDTCIWPSTLGACWIQSVFGLLPERFMKGPCPNL